MRFWHVVFTAGVVSFGLGFLGRFFSAPNSTALFDQARRHAGLHDWPGAERALRQLIAIDPQRTDARIFLSQIAQRRSDWATIAAAFHDVPDTDPNAGPIRLAEGDAWLQINRAVEAEDCWRRARQLLPGDATPIRRLIYLYAIQLRRQLWSDLLWQLYDRRETMLREMVQIMIASHVIWEAEGAMDEMRRYAASDRNDLHSRRALAFYLLHAGNIAAARSELESIRQTNTDDRDTLLALAACHLAAGELDSTRLVLDQLSSDAQDDWRSLKARGSVAALQDRHDQAVRLFQQALERAPFDRELHHKIAQSLRLVGQVEPAYYHAQIAGRLANIDRLCHTLFHQRTPQLQDIRQMVQLCEELGLVEEARGWVRVGLSESPADPAFHEVLNRLQDVESTSPRRSGQAVIRDLEQSRIVWRGNGAGGGLQSSSVAGTQK